MAKFNTVQSKINKNCDKNKYLTTRESDGETHSNLLLVQLGYNLLGILEVSLFNKLHM